MVDGVITTPCQRCKATGAECVIGSSNRGGRRVRKRTLDQAELEDTVSLPPSTPMLDVTAGEYAEYLHSNPEVAGQRTDDSPEAQSLSLGWGCRT